MHLTADRGDAFARLQRGLLAAGIDPAGMFDWNASRAPYPGLLAFQEADAAVFFGRGDEVGAGLDLLNRLRRLGSCALVVVVGASGTGKSSLVRAGLAPRLRRDAERWLVVDPFRPRDDPVAEMVAVWDRAFASFGESARRDSIEAAIRGRSNGDAVRVPLTALADELRRVAHRSEAKVLLVVDQFEELLRPGANDAARVLSHLRAVARAGGRTTRRTRHDAVGLLGRVSAPPGAPRRRQ